MESFLPSEIARLVLGYLEDQKCEEAYTIFLKTSIHLVECLKMREAGRKFRTQVLGLNLLDILYEYSAIYSLVQERLKKVDPEALERLRHSGTLLDKITFLLNSTSSGQTMLFSISLPPGNSPQTSTVAHAHVRKRLRTCSSNEKRKDVSRKKTCDNNDTSIIGASSNIHNLETTNLSSLPGNSVQNISSTGLENDVLRTPKRKGQVNSNKRQSRANSVVPEDMDENFDITALTQALLDNHELHEKIAENINKVICSPENNNGNVSMGQEVCSAQNSPLPETNCNNFTTELDNVIKKIVHDTESDPIFENFLHEVVGPPGQEETSDDYDDRGISDTSTPSKSSVAETVKKQNVKNRNRGGGGGGKLKRANSSENIATSIDDHNAVAIESIISINAPEGDKPCSTTSDAMKMNDVVTTVPAIISPKPVTETTSVIVAESASNVTPVSSLPVASIANQNLSVTTIATTNVTSVEQQQQQQQQQQPTFVIADSFPPIYQQPTIMPDNRIIFLSNKTPAIGSQYIMPSTFQLSQPTTTTTTMRSDDIINMPTVFISDDPKTSSGYIISQSVPKSAKKSRKTANKTKTRSTPRQLLKKPVAPKSAEVEVTKMTQETETIKYTISIQAEPKPTTDTNTNNEAAGSTSANKKDTVAEKNITPEITKSTSTSKMQLSLSSPRSTKSHIRALDFSTPPKEDQSPQKSITPPKSHQKTTKNHKSPKNKKHSSAVFISPVKSSKVPIATKSPKVKLRGEWNQDVIGSSKKSPKEKEKEIQKTLECAEHGYKFCECITKPVVKKLTSWDHELRSLIVPVPSTSTTTSTSTTASTSTIPPKKAAKKRTRVSQRNKDAKEKKANLNTTENEVNSIEAELAKMEGDEPEKEAITDKPVEKEVVADVSKPKETKTDKRKKQTSKSKAVEQKVEEPQITPEKTSETESPDHANNTSQNSDLNKSTSADSLRNMTPKIRKKCNTSSTKKTNSEEKQKTSDNDTNNQMNEAKEVTNPSPTKTDKGASKATFVEPEKDKEFLAPPPTEINKSLPSIITPNFLVKATCSNEVTAKRNLIPVLETPMKDDSLLLPITPRLFTPFNLDSPLSRILGEKLDTGDLAPFLSPSFPMTPSFPITPNLQSGDTQSSYASRPTDYSNSSSYYQPSDSEQNQKLEQVLIDEAMKIETSDLKTKYIKTSTPCKETNEPGTEPIITTNSDTPGVTAKVQLSKSLQEELNNSKKAVDESIDTLTASSANNTSSFSSCSDNTKENVNKDDANITVIHAVNDNSIRSTIKSELRVKLIKTPLIPEPPLPSEIEESVPEEPIKRTRGRPKSPTKRLNDIVKKAPSRQPGRPRKDSTITKAKQDEEEFIEKHRELKSNVTGSHVMLLQELSEKRKRIVSGLNTTNKPSRPTRRKNIKETIKTRTKGAIKKQPKEMNKNRDNIRVTRATVNRMESNEKLAKNKLADKVHEPPFIPRKSKTPQKATIEAVAAKLLKDKKCDEKSEIVPVATNQSFSSPIYSVGSPNVSIPLIGQEDGLVSYTPDEELPRLHISSDEEDTPNETKTIEKQIDDSDLLVKELKERGIYLIPNKEKKTEPEVIAKKSDEAQQENSEKKIATEQLNKDKVDKIEIIGDIHLDKSKVIDVSKIELSQGVLTEVISRTTATKNNESIAENIIVSTQDTVKETVNNSDSTLDTSESSDYDFHVKVIDESSPEYIMYTHDETRKTEKNLSHYNFTVLQRNISAKIYLEEFDRWEDKTFTVTPYTEIYSVTPKKKSKVTKNKTENSTVKINKPTDTNKQKQIVKSSQITEAIPKAAEAKTISKTVEAKTTSKNIAEKTTSKNIAEKTTSKTVETKTTSNPVEIKTTSKPVETKTTSKPVETKTTSKPVDAKTTSKLAEAKTAKASERKITVDTKTNLKPLEILYNECADESSTDTIITIKESEPKTKQSNNENDKKEKQITKDTVTSNKTTVKKTISLEQYKLNKNKDNANTKTTQKTKDEVESSESVDVVDTTAEEDLMNFAVTSQDTSSKKRKATEETLKQSAEKRMKPDKHALLKSIDVDSFLTKLHGSSE